MNYHYGQCHLCDGSLLYPGIDYFYCGGSCQCWVRVATVRPELPLPKPLPSKPLPSHPQQLSLLEGGEA